MTAIDTSTEAVERLLEDVTPGPWAWDESHPTNACAHVTAAIDEGWPFALATLFGESDDVPSPTEPDEPWGDHPIRRADARFIAAARNLVPALLKERDEARARIDELEEFIADFASAKFDSLRRPNIRHPADEPDPVTDAMTVWSWQEDANELLKREKK